MGVLADSEVRMGQVREVTSLEMLDAALCEDRALDTAEQEAALGLLMIEPTAWPISVLPTRLVTGEPLRTRIAARAALAAELMRALRPHAHAAEAVARVERWLLAQCYANGCMVGECAHAGVAVMRYLAASGRPDAPERLARHIEGIRQRRDGSGRWQGLPFFYTLLALSECGAIAADELRYTAPACERALIRIQPDDPYAPRRQAILRRALTPLQLQETEHG